MSGSTGEGVARAVFISRESCCSLRLDGLRDLQTEQLTRAPSKMAAQTNCACVYAPLMATGTQSGLAYLFFLQFSTSHI